MNEISSTKKYVSRKDDVYPRYSVMDPRDEILSGFKEQRVHLWIGFGIFGDILHGIIGIIIETIKADVETIPEYINLFFSCIFID